MEARTGMEARVQVGTAVPLRLVRFFCEGLILQPVFSIISTR